MKKIFILVLLSVLLLNIQYYAEQNSSIKAGISKIDITPTESLIMGGYDSSCRMKPSDGVFGKIYIRCLVFDDNRDRAAFIEVDVVNLPNEDFLTVRKLIEAKTGIPSENIVLGCVHNHASPSTYGENSETKWQKSLYLNIVRAVEDAIADLEPVTIGGGIGTSNIAMNRRKKMEDIESYITFDENNSSQSYGKFKTDNPVMIKEMTGVYRLGSNPDGSIDNQVGVLRIDRVSGEPKAVFINYACHGTSLGGRNNKISPEWNGHMLEYVEENLPGVIGLFAQGAAGDINPKFVGGLDGYKDDLNNTANLGYEIGKEVVNVFNGIETANPIDPKIKIIHEDIECPLKYGLVVKDFKTTTIDVPTTAIKIDEFVWVTFPGELFHAIGQSVKMSTHARYPFLVGYSNGSLGYLPTQKAYSEGGYEPWTTRFAPVTEKIYKKGVENMLIGLH